MLRDPLNAVAETSKNKQKPPPRTRTVTQGSFQHLQGMPGGGEDQGDDTQAGREAHTKLTPPGHGFPRGTITGLGRAQGCITPDFDPCPASSAASSLPQPIFTGLIQAPPGVPVQLPVQCSCLALPRGCREGDCCGKGCFSGVGLGAIRGRGTMGGSHVSASQ